jgi:hypothetical protein
VGEPLSKPIAVAVPPKLATLVKDDHGPPAFPSSNNYDWHEIVYEHSPQGLVAAKKVIADMIREQPSAIIVSDGYIEFPQDKPGASPSAVPEPSVTCSEWLNDAMKTYLWKAGVSRQRYAKYMAEVSAVQRVGPNGKGFTERTILEMLKKLPLPKPLPGGR